MSEGGEGQALRKRPRSVSAGDGIGGGESCKIAKVGEDDGHGKSSSSSSNWKNVEKIVASPSSFDTGVDPVVGRRVMKKALAELERHGKGEEERKIAILEGTMKSLDSFESRTVKEYTLLRQIGLGTYGEVYQARRNSDKTLVALKKLKVHNRDDGYPITALREIKILQKLRHENIVRLLEIVPSSTELKEDDLGAVYMVLEYLDNDLTGILENPHFKLTDVFVKCYMKQLLEGLHYIHTNRIMHRDLKAANILVSNDSKLKIGDWGLSRPYKPEKPYTSKVVTLWYRAPELLLGVTHYTPAVDMWAVGCIFVELLGKVSPLPGKKEIEQLDLIFDLCGTPTESTWPGVSQTPGFQRFNFRQRDSTIDKRFAWMKPLELDLFKRFLTLDPRKRITANQALDHDYFWKGTAPGIPGELPLVAGDGYHEFELRREHLRKKEEQKKRQQRVLPPKPGKPLPLHKNMKFERK